MNRALAVLVLLLALLAVPHDSSASHEAVAATISGPRAVAPSSTHAYEVVVTGGPAAHEGTFEISYVLQGDNLRGGDPQAARTLANRQGRFTVNVTAPEVEGPVQLFVRAKSTDEAGVNATTETRLTIEVFRPIDLRATIRNNGAATALNITVFFFVDDQPVGNTTVARIEAGGQVEVNISYIPVDLAVGRHTAKVTADVDRDGVIEPAAGELQEVDFFYKTERSNVPAILGTLTVVVLGILVLVLLAIRRRRREGA